MTYIVCRYTKARPARSEQREDESQRSGWKARTNRHRRLKERESERGGKGRREESFSNLMQCRRWFSVDDVDDEEVEDEEVEGGEEAERREWTRWRRKDDDVG